MTTNLAGDAFLWRRPVRGVANRTAAPRRYWARACVRRVRQRRPVSPVNVNVSVNNVCEPLPPHGPLPPPARPHEPVIQHATWAPASDPGSDTRFGWAMSARGTAPPYMACAASCAGTRLPLSGALLPHLYD